MAEQRQRDDDLDRIWDEIAGGRIGDAMDHSMDRAETIRAFQAFASAPVPDAARERIWRGLAGKPGNGLNGKETTMFANGAGTLSGPGFGPNGRVRPTAARRQASASRSVPVALRRRVGSLVSLVSLAAVLLLALAGGLVAIRSRTPGSDDVRFGSIPAVQVSPEASPPAGPVEFLWETSGDPASPLGLPAHLAIAPDGAIWVADGDHNRFQIFEPDGALREVWGEPGSGDGQFEFTAVGLPGYDQGAVAFAPDGTFYVADPGNHRIQKFGPDRSFLLSWGSEGQEPGQFATPVDLVVDEQGRVYVVDRFRNSLSAGSGVGAVQVFDADGRFLFQWGERGTEPGHLSGPFAIGRDADGTLLVADFANSRVQRFTPAGEPLQLIGGSGTADGRFMSVMGAAADGQGRIYATDYHNLRVQVFDRAGRFLAAWGEPGTDPGEFAGPLGVAVGGDGTVYVTDESKRLQAFRVGDLPEPAATPAS